MALLGHHKPGRTNAWWFSFCNETLPEEWKANFRMCKQTFDVLCRKVNPYISRKITHLRTPVPKQIAITLYYLSDGGRMKKKPSKCVRCSATLHGFSDREMSNTSNFNSPG